MVISVFVSPRALRDPPSSRINQIRKAQAVVRMAKGKCFAFPTVVTIWQTGRDTQEARTARAERPGVVLVMELAERFVVPLSAVSPLSLQSDVPQMLCCAF